MLIKQPAETRSPAGALYLAAGSITSACIVPGAWWLLSVMQATLLPVERRNQLAPSTDVRAGL
jgi:hypothetical protein